MAHYTTNRGRTYEFSFERQFDGGIRPYIVRQPGYGSRDNSSTSTHRVLDGAGRSSICWTKNLTNEQEAMKLATGWSDLNDVFIETGIWKRYCHNRMCP